MPRRLGTLVQGLTGTRSSAGVYPWLPLTYGRSGGRDSPRVGTMASYCGLSSGRTQTIASLGMSSGRSALLSQGRCVGREEARFLGG